MLMKDNKNFKNLSEKVNLFIAKHDLLNQNDSIVIGLSGGPDSVFLLHILHDLKKVYNLNIIAAHLDHGWRENSHLDVIFCKELTEKLGIKFVSWHASQIKDLQNFKKTGSKEDLGRQMRRKFFREISKEFGANKIALAHHQDDQIETFFIRLLRGAGVAGLSSIRPRFQNIIRPLLSINKKEIVFCLEEMRIKYLVDYTNVSDMYLRNRIRNYVVPALEKADNRFQNSCIHTIENLQVTEIFLEKITEQIFKDISTKSEQEFSSKISKKDICRNFFDKEISFKSLEIYEKYLIDLKKFRVLDKFLQKRILLYWLCLEKVQFTLTTPFLEEILRFLEKNSGGEHWLSETWSIVKKKNKAYILA
jgi:tRNA(Ile)-lysidine synthase